MQDGGEQVVGEVEFGPAVAAGAVAGVAAVFEEFLFAAGREGGGEFAGQGGELGGGDPGEGGVGQGVLAGAGGRGSGWGGSGCRV